MSPISDESPFVVCDGDCEDVVFGHKVKVVRAAAFLVSGNNEAWFASASASIALFKSFHFGGGEFLPVDQYRFCLSAKGEGDIIVTRVELGTVPNIF